MSEPGPGDAAAHRAILTKRDTRRYEDRVISSASLDRVLAAGRMAGSAKNGQGVRVIVVSDERTKSDLAACGDFADWLPTAPLVLVLCVRADAGPRRLFDVGRVAQNMMVAANIEQLASCPVTMHRDPCCRSALDVPEDFEVPMVISMGHRPPPDPERRSHPRIPVDEFVSWGRWRAPRPPAIVCHLVTRSEWDDASAAGSHRPASLDAEGFIHFSTVAQLAATADRYHAGNPDLLAVCASTAALSGALRFERPTAPDSPVADEFFPHLYRSLSIDEALLVAPMTADTSGFTLPPEVAECERAWGAGEQ